MRTGNNHAGVDAKASPPNIPSFMQRANTVSNSFRKRSLSRKRPWRFLEVAVLGKCRMIRNLAVETQATEPAVGQIEVNFLAQPTLGTNAQAVADDEHPDHQLGIDRW